MSLLQAGRERERTDFEVVNPSNGRKHIIGCELY